MSMIHSIESTIPTLVIITALKSPYFDPVSHKRNLDLEVFFTG